MMAAQVTDDLPRWNLSQLYSGDQDPQMQKDRLAVEAAVQAFIQEWGGDRTDYLTDLVVLAEALAAYERLCRVLNEKSEPGGTKPGFYFTLRRAEDLADEEVRQRLDELTEWEEMLRTSVRFFAQNIEQMPPALELASLADLRLMPYGFWLRERFNVTKPGLSDADANQLARRKLSAYNAVVAFDKKLSACSARVWNGTEMTEVPFANLTSMLTSGDPLIRRSAAEALDGILAGLAPAATTQLNGVLMDRLAIAQLRGYAGDAFREQLEKDGLTPAGIDAMLGVARAQLSASQAFYAFRTNLGGVAPVPYAERGAPYGSAALATISFPKAVEIIRKVYAKFGPWFVEQFDWALQEGLIDAQPRANKRSGAACWDLGIDFPPFANLTFTGHLRDVQTFAHEAGHLLEALRRKLMGCNSLTFDAPVPLKEAYGTLVEFLVIQELLADPSLDDESRLTLLLAGLDGEVVAIFRHVAATDFERELYRRVAANGALTQQEIGELFAEYMQSYLGDSVSMEGAEAWWVHWRHFRLGFYNYGYVFAGLVARALRARVDEDPAFMDVIVELMGSGTRLSPQELLASVGLDMSDPALWHDALQSWRETFEEAQAIARKLGLV